MSGTPRNRRRLLVLMALAAALAFTGLARAADFPNKPIQLIVPYGPGGSTDVMARAIAQIAPKYFPVQMIVVNKPGGGGIPGRVEVARAKADGYTILVGWGSGEDLTVPHQRALPYEPFKAFETLARISVHTHALFVQTESPHKTLKDLIAWARTREYVTSSVATKGSGGDVGLHVFGKLGGFKMQTVPGAGGAEAITRLVGGHVDMGVVHPSEGLAHVKAGRVRGLAVMFETRDPAIPDVPTFRESGLDLATAGSVKGLALPAGTPKEIVQYLAAGFKKITEDAEFQKMMKEVGQPVLYMGPAEYKPWLLKAYDDYGKFIKMAGVETK
ncbi:MAG: Bug family tripartite tricarboxylate transporter substrate binding protein [Candidatus Methylomirabilales bacterium]